MTNANKVNSCDYWEGRFSDDWESFNGPKQSRFFSNIAVKNIPAWLRDLIRRERLTFVDWGCAQGDGTDVWANYFDSSRVFGVDFSSVAIEQAGARYPAIKFINSDWLSPDATDAVQYDVVYSSNTLEHFHRPYEVLEKISSRASKAIILALPYREIDRIEEHFYSFLPQNIPLQSEGGFQLCWSKVIDCKTIPESWWSGEQIVLVYGRADWLHQLKLTLDDVEFEKRDFSTELNVTREANEENLNKVLSLTKTIELRDKQILMFSQAMTSRDKHFVGLNQSISDRNEQIAALNQSLAKRDIQIAEQSSSLAVRDRQIAELSSALAERDREISQALTSALAEREHQIHLSHNKQSRIDELNAAISDRDEKIESLNLSIIERDQRIAALNEATSQHDENMASLQRSVGVQEEHIKSLLEQIEDKAARIDSMGEYVSSLTQQLQEKTQHIHRLEDSVRSTSAALVRSEDLEIQQREVASNLYHQLERVLASNSWYITKPLRFVRRLIGAMGSSKDDKAVLCTNIREIGRSLPVSPATKAKARVFLFDKLQDSSSVTNVKRNVALSDANSASVRTDIGGASVPVDDMRASWCGLVADLVSVVLPVYNQASMLGDSIESVLTQTYQNFELIVLNDGSTDGVEGVLAKYVGHPKVRIYTQKNQRLPKALTSAFEFARGEFWTWTSADNLMEPKHLEVLVRSMKADPSIGMVYSDYIAIDDRGEVLHDPNWRAHNRPDLLSGEIRIPRSTESLNTVQDNFIGASFMYRGWIGRIVGEYDPIQGIEDYDYWMRINSLFSIAHIGTDDLLYRYRVHDNALNARAAEERILEKVQRLMEYEKSRSDFYQAPMIVYSDGAHAAVKAIASRAGLEIRDIESVNGVNLDDDFMVVIGSDNLEKYSEFLNKCTERPLAVVFNESYPSPYDLVHWLTQSRVIAVALSEATAERIRSASALVPIIDGYSVLAADALRGFGKNFSFYERTREKELRERLRPVAFKDPERRINVVLQADDFLQGGMENVMIDLARTLNRSGFNAWLVALGKTGAAVQSARDSGIRVDLFNGGVSKALYRSYLVDNKVDLVNAHYSAFGAQIACELGLPFLQTVHNAYVWLEPNKIAEFREADAFTTRYLCVSHYVAKYSDHVLNWDRKKISVVPNGIDLTRFEREGLVSDAKALRASWGFGDQAHVFLNVASILATKAQVPMVKAFGRLYRKNPNLRLVFLGASLEPEYEKSLLDLIKKLKLSDVVKIASHDKDVAKYYFAADTFIQPSFWEGWSLSFGEALFSGVPIVSSDVGAALEYQDVGNIEIVRPTFGDVTNLNYQNLAKYVYQDDPEYVSRIELAMEKALVMVRIERSDSFKRNMDKYVAYERYAAFFNDVHYQS